MHGTFKRSGTRRLRTRQLRLEHLENRELLAVLTDPLIVGGVTSSEAQVFARVNATASVAIQYSTSTSFSGTQTTIARNATSPNDFTTILPLQGLLPETQYYYRAVINGTPVNDATVHSFVTYAAPNTVAQFSFAVTADLQNINADPSVPAPVYSSIAAEDHAFLMQVGDIDHRNPSRLSGMREMHREVRGPGNASGADFAKYIAPTLPVVYVWDDHDFGGNNSDKNFSGKAAALQAYNEYYPTVTRPNQAGIWHSFRYGQAEFFMLDVRSQRDPASQTDGPSKSMLDGNNIANDQLTWLKSGLLNSTSTWKFIASGVAFNPTTKPADSWGAYARERQELVNFIENNGITGVIVLSGDLHSGGAIDDGRNSDFPEMSVPHTNLHSSKRASGPAGSWSQGIDSGAIPGGYSTVTVTADKVILQTRAVNGTVKKSFTILQQQTSNLSPTVNAGPNQTITLPANSVSLDATVWDDDFPSFPLTTIWTKVSGPGTVGFGSTTGVDTTATFSEAGTYILRLTADDGQFSVSDDVQVVVNPLTVEASVISFTLINADTDLPLGLLTNGQTINLADLPTQRLNLRADTAGTIGSVRFGFDSNARFRTESSSPYSLFGDYNGDYKAGTFTLGAHALTATPFSGTKASGSAGNSLSISFAVINETSASSATPIDIETSSTTYVNSTETAPSFADVVRKRPNRRTSLSHSTLAASTPFNSQTANAMLITEQPLVSQQAWKTAFASFAGHGEKKRPATQPEVASDVLASAFESFGHVYTF